MTRVLSDAQYRAMQEELQEARDYLADPAPLPLLLPFEDDDEDMRASCGLTPLTSTVPSLICSKSAITRNSVVLPQPDGPIKDTNSPSPMRRSILLRALTGVSAVW